MRKIRLLAGRMLCGLMALHLFNLSVDMSDKRFFGYSGKPDDLSINKMESFMEFFAEVILGKSNVFPETEENDDQRAINKFPAILLFLPQAYEPFYQQNWPTYTSAKWHLMASPFPKSLSLIPISPPPWQ